MLGKVGVQLLEGHSDKELRQLHGLFTRRAGAAKRSLLIVD